MNVPRLFKRNLIRWRTLHKAVTICVLASLLAGLIPPPVVGSTLPTAFAEPIAALLPDTPVALAAGTISGTVFQDFNSDGSLSSGTVTDIGMAGVTVTVYDSDGAAQGTDQTDATGGYSIAATGTGPYRVEFTTLPTGYYPTTHNSNSGSNTTAPNSTATTAGTTVQFVPDGNSSNVNLGINRPEAYAQSDVRLAVPMQLAGDQSETSAVLYDWPYTNSGTTPTARTAAQASQIGTTWGLAYQRTTKTLFASAVVRRHAGLGSLGLGGIYQIDYASGSPVASTFVDLDAAPFSANFGTLGNNSTRGLPATPTTASQDTSAFAAVAKEGIGDIDLSEDGNTLWVVNLNGVTSNVAGTLLALDVTGGTAPTSATSYAISSFSGLPTCTNGVLRPWALKFANGKGYLGAVCSAELAGGVRDNLVGYVLSFDPDAPTAFTTELTIPMGSTYGKGIALQLTSAADLPNIAPNTEQWYPWTDTYTDVSFNRSPNGLIVARPTPVLSDIEFDESGHLIVGFLDRAAMQLGSVNYPPTSTAYTIQVIGSGDVVRACVDGAGTYTLESNGACGGLNGAGVGNGDGPGGGEYYHDLFTLFTLQHQEILNGGLAVLAGTREIAATAFDPVTSLDTAGILFLANSTGAKNDGYQVGPTNQKNSTNGYFAKSFGIGDIELLADPAPLEIGNRVWNDADSDGLQDPNEAPISGVTVELYKNGVKVGQATTDATGEYYFTSGTSASDANTSDNIIHDSGIGILPGTGANGGDSLYEIRIPNVSGGSKQAALGSNSLTTANAGSDSIDSDGSISGVNASYAIPYADLAGSGYNNHTYDFGFGPPTGTIQIVKNTVGGDGTFAFTSADTQLDAVSITTVGNTGNSGTAFTKNGGSYTISEDALPANWALTGLSCSGDTDSGSVVTLASRQVIIDLDANENIVCTFTNTYTAPVVDSGVLTLTKTLVGDPGSVTSYVVTVNGPSGYVTNTTITAGVNKVLTGLANGVYTVTETSPGAGWTTTYAVTTGTGTASANNAVVTLAGQTQGANLLTNGSFESDSGSVSDPTTPDRYPGLNTLTGWTVIPGPFSLKPDLLLDDSISPAPNPPVYYNAAEGTKFLGSFGINNGGIAVTQSFNVTAGKSYALTFKYAWGAKYSTGSGWIDIPTSGTWDVTVTGAATASQSFTGASADVNAAANPNASQTNPVAWRSGTLTFNATSSGSATLTFKSVSPDQSYYFLDDVSVSESSTGNAAATVAITNTAPPSVPDSGGFRISKAIATTDGSNPSVSGSFAVVVSCPGVSGYPATLSLNADGTPITAGNLAAGTVCSFSEDTLTLPSAPSGYTWVNAQIDPASITIQSNVTATVTATNWLAPLPTQPTHVLTVTKTISGTGNGPFAITITGPSGYITNTQIDGGDVLTFSVPAQGVYTITESTPAGWTTVYTATPGTVSSVNGVVTLANENTATLASTPINGKVFRDFNSDGLVTANGVMTDTGISAVTVTAYDKNGNSVGNATTASDGTYTINPTGDGPYRVEFTNLPSGYEPTTHGAANGTSTQFVTTAGGASNVNLGILMPCDYCQENPRVATIVMRPSAATTAISRSIASQLYNAITTTAPYREDAQMWQTGSIWGLGYQNSSQKMFVSTMLKRHVGLGPQGSGGVYVLDYSDPVAATLAHSFTLQGVTPSNGGAAIDLGSVNRTVVAGTISAGAAGDYELPADGANPSRDMDAFAKIGKMAFGDADVDERGNSLWLVNLYQRALVQVAVNGNVTTLPGQVNQYPIVGASGVPTCVNGELRPWALGFRAGTGYLGAVCDASTSQSRNDLQAYVLSFDPENVSAGFAIVVTVPLTQVREGAEGANGVLSLSPGPTPTRQDANWKPWADTWAQTGLGSATPSSYAQPILADIDFMPDGSMVLGFANRFGDQAGRVNYIAESGSLAQTSVNNAGDLVKLCNINGTFVLESYAGCPVFDTLSATSLITDGYSGTGEFFFGEGWRSGAAGRHPETANGAVAIHAGRATVLATSYDPQTLANAFTSGLRFLNANTGDANFGWIIEQRVEDRTSFGKANAMGDVELLCDPAPIEIGNRVWNDLDGDGIQDPGEPGLNGVQVSLEGPTGTVSVNTDSNGAYYFGNLQSATAYTLTMNVPTAYSLTTPNAAAISGASVSSNHAISDTRDSDAVLVGGVATIYYTTGRAGQNNHSLDFGFTQPVDGQVDILNSAPVVSLGNRVWYDTNNNGAVDGGEQNVGNGVAVELYQDSDSSGGFSAGDNRLASTVTSGGYYTFTNLTPSSSDATRYLVVITDTNFLAGGLLYGYHNSAGQVTDNSLAADNNKDHGAVSGTLGQNGGVVASTVISLTAGTQPTGEANEGNDPIQSATDANSNQTIDFGFYSLSVGNRVWIDDGASANADNGQLDSGESGLDGVTVELLDSSNAVVSTTTTSNGGYYTFTGLISGTYRVRISGYPASYRSSTDTVNAAAPTSADDDDNGPGTGTGTLTSSGFALVPGSSANGHSANNATGVTSNPRIDFGLYAAPASFALDKRLVSPVSGVAAVGDPVVYTLVVTNTGAITLTTITLVDSYDANWLQYNSASTAPTAQATGVLTWTLTSPTTPLPLSAGEVMTVTVTFTAVKP